MAKNCNLSLFWNIFFVSQHQIFRMLAFDFRTSRQAQTVSKIFNISINVVQFYPPPPSRCVWGVSEPPLKVVKKSGKSSLKSKNSSRNKPGWQFWQNYSQILIKYWSNTNQIRVIYWSNTHEIMIKNWLNTNKILIKYPSNSDQILIKYGWNTHQILIKYSPKTDQKIKYWSNTYQIRSK